MMNFQCYLFQMNNKKVRNFKNTFFMLKSNYARDQNMHTQIIY